MELSSLLYQMESFAQYIEQYANSGQLSVTVDGQQVMAVTDSVTTTGEYLCDVGQGSYYFFCSKLFGMSNGSTIFYINTCDSHSVASGSHSCQSTDD